MKISLTKDGFNEGLKELSKEYRVFAPKLFPYEGRFSDTDLIRYANIDSLEEMVLDKKSEFSPKEVLSPQTETMFYFTEKEYKEPDLEVKPALIFLRSCDLHSVKRFDEIYLRNKFTDNYYAAKRENVKFAVIGCGQGFDSCFCVSMETNKIDTYDMAMNVREDMVELHIQDESLKSRFNGKKVEFEIDFAMENKVKVEVPDNIELKDVIDLEMWREYDKRCVACGRCNFVCPTCTCNTMQDIYYTENKNVGERRRVWASCHVDNFSMMAGDHDFRTKHGDRMRFKTMHKIADYKRRFGYHMCTGCGRCDDTCPEYISFSNAVNKLTKELKGNDK